LGTCLAEMPHWCGMVHGVTVRVICRFTGLLLDLRDGAGAGLQLCTVVFVGGFAVIFVVEGGGVLCGVEVWGGGALPEF